MDSSRFGFLKFFLAKIRIGTRFLFRGEESNYDFGHAEILMEYAGVNQKKKLRGRYQHGWYAFADRDFWINDYVHTYVWNQEMIHKAKARHFNDYLDIGSSWLYFLEVLKRRGLLDLVDLSMGKIDEIWVFGSHSTKSQKANMESLENFVMRAEESPARSKLVLLYELDYQFFIESMNSSSFTIPIITLGPRNSSFYSKSHFFNLFHLLISTKLMITNYPTSLVCYSISLNRDVRWFKDNDFLDALDAVKTFGSSQLHKLMESEKVDATEQKNFVMSELGINSMRSPEELRNLFFWNSGLYNSLRVLGYVCIQCVKVLTRVLKKPGGVGYPKVS